MVKGAFFRYVEITVYLLGSRLAFEMHIRQGVNSTVTRQLFFVQILNQSEARYNSADMNIAYRMSVDEYQRLCPYAEELEENWGKPPGKSLVMLHNVRHR